VFESVSWGEVLVLVVAALFILGPERLPGAMAWVGRGVRKVREFATGARDQLREEIGPEYEQFRKPMEDLRSLRSFDPKRAVIDHVFDGDDDPLGFNDNGNSRPARKTAGESAAPRRTQPEVLAPGEKPPVDPDAT
jgi:sec-independent protein translocase protein TatB